MFARGVSASEEDTTSELSKVANRLVASAMAKAVQRVIMEERMVSIQAHTNQQSCMKAVQRVIMEERMVSIQACTNQQSCMRG